MQLTCIPSMAHMGNKPRTQFSLTSSCRYSSTTNRHALADRMLDFALVVEADV